MGGYPQLVRGEAMRGKFRNSFSRPEPFEPGKMTQVEFVLPDAFHTFRRGHRIMVHVQSSWFPLVDRNPQTFCDIYRAREEDFRKATQRVYRSPEAGSTSASTSFPREERRLSIVSPAGVWEARAEEILEGVFGDVLEGIGGWPRRRRTPRRGPARAVEPRGWRARRDDPRAQDGRGCHTRISPFSETAASPVWRR
jgi:hypothetical protein